MFIIIVLLSHASLVLVVYPLNTNLVLIASLLFFVKLTDCHDAVYERVTKNSVRGIWARRSKLDLVGAHINVFTGEWTQKVLTFIISVIVLKLDVISLALCC
jgi:hypothetical protein